MQLKQTAVQTHGTKAKVFKVSKVHSHTQT